MSNIQNEMNAVLRNRKLSATQKLHFLNSYSTRFDKLRKESGILSGAPGAAALLALPVAVPAAAAPAAAMDEVEEEGEKGEGEEGEEEGEGEGEEGEEGVEGEKVEAPAAHAQASPGAIIRQLGFTRMYQAKAQRLYEKMVAHRDYIAPSEQGELVINGEVIVGSDFNRLFKSMVGTQRDLTQPGMKRFLRALRRIGVTPLDLTGEDLKSMFNGLSASKKSVPQRLYEARREDVSGATLTTSTKRPKSKPATAADEQFFDARSPRPAVAAASSSSISKSKIQQQQQHQKGNGAPRPPGKRPNILYVYN